MSDSLIIVNLQLKLLFSRVDCDNCRGVLRQASQGESCYILEIILSSIFLQLLKRIHMNGQYRKDVYPGLEVAIILKKDQRTGKLTYGIVKDLLTSAAYHSRGIKVRLEDGQVGRVAETDVVDPDGE
jgi:uncharacterized repeat protein (TIGR03833 family)